MIAATQVEISDTFTQLLEKRLNASSLPRMTIEVVNAGVDGYGTAQQLIFFRQIASEYRPDIVLLGVFPLNDIMDNHPGAGSWNHFVAIRCGRPYFDKRDGRLVALSEGAPSRPALDSYVERFLRLSLVYSSMKLVPTSATNGPVFRKDQIYDENPPESVWHGWELTKSLILELRHEVERRGSEFAVIMVPAKGELRDGGDPGQSADGAASRPQRLLEEFLRSSGLSYINLIPSMSERPGNSSAYFPHDMHWNAQGNADAAGVVEDWLLENCSMLELPIEGCEL